MFLSDWVSCLTQGETTEFSSTRSPFLRFFNLGSRSTSLQWEKTMRSEVWKLPIDHLEKTDWHGEKSEVSTQRRERRDRDSAGGV